LRSWVQIPAVHNKHSLTLLSIEAEGSFWGIVLVLNLWH
jgi:hypothetical protein